MLFFCVSLWLQEWKHPDAWRKLCEISQMDNADHEADAAGTMHSGLWTVDCGLSF